MPVFLHTRQLAQTRRRRLACVQEGRGADGGIHRVHWEIYLQ